MHLYFGLNIQNGLLPMPKGISLGVYHLGPQQFLQLLEDHLGLAVPNQDIEYLRIEQYRQALTYYLNEDESVFYKTSFEADDLGTAAELLSRRDELLLSDWDFGLQSNMPSRLRVLAIIESYWRSEENSLKLFSGKADRLQKVKQEIVRAASFIDQIQLCDEWNHLPFIWQEILSELKNNGVKILDYQPPTQFKNTDLGHFQAFLNGEQKGPLTLQGDGSLRIIRAYRETHLAAWLAKLVQKNQDFQPALLLPQAKRTLENSFMMEDLPSLGVASASLARPSLQVLKLVPVFLWNPIDINKVMEFVALAVKPLEEGLANRITAFLSNTPGLFSDRWFAMINDYFKKELPEKALKRTQLDVVQIEEEYQFWFRRKRVDSRTEKVTKRDVRAIYKYLHEWAIEMGKQEESTTSIKVLISQSGKLLELLDTLPETELSYLELERIVRTIYQPAPVKYREAEAHKLDTVHHVGAVTAKVKSLVWWDFFENEKDYFFSRWYPQELAYLNTRNIQIEGPVQQNERLLSQRKRPVLWTQDHLLLCIPDFCDGENVDTHPLLGDLEAAFGESLHGISYYVDSQEENNGWAKSLELPQFQLEKAKALPKPRPFIELEKELPFRDIETPTSIEQILYYPYQWVFRHQIKLKKSNLLSVIDDFRLYGNLSHRLIEILLKQDWESWTKQDVDAWVAKEIPILLNKEGTTLLMYGREPERIAFIKHMKFAAWSLICLLKNDRWKVSATEYKLEGKWQDVNLVGRADLVLERDKEQTIVDLKWRGATRYSNILRNAEDIQLALYANLLSSGLAWPHTAYFIIEKAKMIARNTHAFSGAQAVQHEADHEAIYEGMMNEIATTFAWRKEQLHRGEIEIRCAHTYETLEDIYGDQLLNLLEMKSTNARFDDYDALIGLVS